MRAHPTKKPAKKSAKTPTAKAKPRAKPKTIAARRVKATPKRPARALAKRTLRHAPAERAITRQEAREAELQGVLDAALFPTARAYAEEELHILSVARAHPKLGDRFIRDATRRVETQIPKKDRGAFLAAMATVDVEARADVVVAKMEEYWGVPLDEETKSDVRDDVRAMYAGD